MKRLILVLSALAVIAAPSACGSSTSVPPPAAATAPARKAASARASQPSAAQTGVRLGDFHSVNCNLLGPGENDDPRLVFEVELRVNSGITVTVHSLTIQWHQQSLTGPVIATETVPVGPGKPPVTDGIAWAFAWATSSGLTVSENSATGPHPVACAVTAISGTTAARRSGS